MPIFEEQLRKAKPPSQGLQLEDVQCMIEDGQICRDINGHILMRFTVYLCHETTICQSFLLSTMKDLLHPLNTLVVSRPTILRLIRKSKNLNYSSTLKSARPSPCSNLILLEIWMIWSEFSMNTFMEVLSPSLPE